MKDTGCLDFPLKQPNAIVGRQLGSNSYLFMQRLEWRKLAAYLHKSCRANHWRRLYVRSLFAKQPDRAHLAQTSLFPAPNFLNPFLFFFKRLET